MLISVCISSKAALVFTLLVVVGLVLNQVTIASCKVVHVDQEFELNLSRDNKRVKSWKDESNDEKLLRILESWQNDFLQLYKDLRQKGSETAVLYMNSHHTDFLFGLEQLKRDQDEFALTCTACTWIFKTIQEMLHLGASYTTIGHILSTFCHVFHIEKADVCNGVIDQFKDEILQVLSNLSSKTASLNYICGILLRTTCSGEPKPEPEWNVTFPNIPKPPVIPPKPPKAEFPKLRVLHLTDVHIDFLYKPGSNADCGKPLCCQEGKPKGEPAGKWGDYRVCDIPPWTVEHLFQNLSQSTKFDYILWTGDLPSHIVWNQTRAKNLGYLNQLTELFLKYFPGVPVYSAVGNHETVPVNSFPPPFIKGNLSISWLYNGLYKSWSHWLPNDTLVNISRGGFYSTPVRPGFRIISLNNNYCNQGNWWLFLNSTDPADELAWLIGILQHAETNNEKVHIIGHIPTGASECLRTWSWNYYRIVNRYEGVIAGQFFGHKHYDTWEVFYDIASDFKRPISVAYAAPSVTTYVGLNPGFRVYEIDGFYPNSSWMVLDHETFIMNLTESNKRDQPVWFKEYSAKSAYNMTSLMAKDWNDVIEMLRTDESLFAKYLKFYYKSHLIPNQPCDVSCRKMMICELRCALSNDLRPCHNILSGSDDMATNYFKWSQAKVIC